MGRYDGLLICSDFDGTLCHGGRISRENREAIGRFRAGGGRFTLATGRYPGHILNLMGEDVDRTTPMICLNGGLLCDLSEDRILFCGTMPDGYADTLVGAGRLEGIRDIMVFPARAREPVELHPLDEAGIRAWMEQDIIKAVIHVEDEVSDEVKAWTLAHTDERYRVARSWINGVEIHGASYDKGILSRRLATMLGADTLICVGDYENDLAMIREADIGVAMGNGVDELKAEADMITASAEEHGIAQLIDSL